MKSVFVDILSHAKVDILSGFRNKSPNKFQISIPPTASAELV